MIIKIATFICVVVCLGANTEAEDASSVIARSVIVFEKQRAIKLPVGVAFVASISQKIGNQNSKETNISVLLNESGTGIDASYRKGNRSNKSHISVALVNPDYGAVADRKNTNALRSSFMLNSLDKQGFSLDTYWKNDETAGSWLQETVKMKLSSRYFNLGNTEFSEAIRDWQRRNGKVDFEEGVGASKLYELRFSDWPVGDENKMTYRIDPESFVIREIEGSFGGTRAKLEVLEFTNFKDVPFPKRTKLTNKQPSGETLVKECEWNESTIESVGFVQEQLYLPFYGLPHPDLGELPKEKPSLTYLYVVAGFIFLVVAWLISKKYRN